jgi:hypothetical protein
LGGHVSDTTTGDRNVGADHEWAQAGIRSRSFFGPGPRAASLSLGLDLWQYQFDVPSYAALREKIQTYGLAFSLEGELPTNATYSWTFRLTAVPLARHEEISTQDNARSGASPETNIVEAAIGGRVAFDRSNALFWRLTCRIEQDSFSGSASAPDFQTGQVPTGVSVMNSFTIFELGYSWGN